MATGRTCVRSQGACFAGVEASLSYVQCLLSLVSSLINVSFFMLHDWILHITHRHRQQSGESQREQG